MSAGRRLGALLLGNLLVTAFAFLVLELGVRIHHDGFRAAFSRLLEGEPAPYSNLGTGKWVIYDAELGYRLNPGVGEINALSIRRPDVAVPKPAGRFRVVVLGDSIPWDKPGFVDDLSARLAGRPDVEVINAAVPGYTSYQELLFFERYLLQTEPDLLIWAYCLNDNHKFLHRFDEAAHMLITDEAKESLEIRSWWDFVVSRSAVLSTLRIGLLTRREGALAASAKFPWESRPDFNIAWKDYSWAFYEGHLSEMVKLLSGRKARLALVVFPYEPQVLLRAKRDERDYILAPQEHLARLCRKYTVPCLDLYPAFESAYDRHEVLYRDDIHLNREGHALTAAELLRFLDDENLLPRSPTRDGSSPAPDAGR